MIHYPFLLLGILKTITRCEACTKTPLLAPFEDVCSCASFNVEATTVDLNGCQPPRRLIHERDLRAPELPGARSPTGLGHEPGGVSGRGSARVKKYDTTGTGVFFQSTNPASVVVCQLGEKRQSTTRLADDREADSLRFQRNCSIQQIRVFSK